jgi:hypothetical protein
VSTLKKSVSTMAEAWARRNAFQLNPERSGAGPIRFRRSNLRIVVAETMWPSLSSSPRIRTQPHFGFSRDCQNQLPNVGIQARSTRAAPATEGCPFPAHQLAMPTENRFGLDQHPDPSSAVHTATQRGHDRPIRHTEVRGLHVTPHHSQLVAEQQQFSFGIADAQPDVDYVEE